jgi:ABC-type siderophore export system fused ATPase/permease subunit
MTVLDSMMDPQPGRTPVAAEIVAARRKRKIVHGTILSGWILTVLTMVAIIGTALYMMTRLDYAKLPEELAQWCGIALGFLFGSFTSIVKDFITEPPEP